MARIEANLFEEGAWQEVTTLFDQMPSEVKAFKTRMLGTLTAKAEAIVLGHLSNQDLNWEKLTDAYVERKRRRGLSEFTLVATNTMRQNITAFIRDDQGFVGVKRGVEAEGGNGIDLVNIAAIHEFGYKPGNIPERKLWRPSLKETRQFTAKKRNFFVEQWKKMLENKYGKQG